MEPRRVHKQDYEKIKGDGRLVATETLYVNAWSNDTANWNTHTGSSPYLHDTDVDLINGFTQNVLDDHYSFGNVSGEYLWAAVTSIKLYVQEKDNSEVAGFKAELSVDDAAWFTAIAAGGFWGDATYRWEISANLIANFASIANINSCIMRVTKLGAASGTTTLRRAYLEVTYTVAGGQQIKTLIEEYDY